jgi:hypothetical protein
MGSKLGACRPRSGFLYLETCTSTEAARRRARRGLSLMRTIVATVTPLAVEDTHSVYGLTPSLSRIQPVRTCLILRIERT